MAERLRLFVSAGPDLEAEREIIGQAVARLPVSLGWTIKRTPRRGEPLAPALEAVRACDFYVLLLGTDIRAPVGLELITAQRARKTTLAFLREETARTPAARVFIRDAQIIWTSFHSGQELETLIQKALAQRILEGAASYAISPVEWETLSALVEQPSPKETAELELVEAGGAGGGGVIIAPGRDLPPGGVLVGESTKKG
ncbi:MAG: hypothetical protein ISS50_02095 [Anaerolineae bacterium]|nr:hypothetical protein [Anaerolineae bacterium]